MNREKALQKVKPHLTEARYEHTIRVLETAVELGERFGEDQSKIELAAAFHDYAKYWNKEEMKKIILENDLPEDMLAYQSELWHGPVGAVLVRKEYGIEDQDILNAIEWHTTGHANMSKLEKIIFLADYIEPGRNFLGLQEVREAALMDLDEACFLTSRNTIAFLVSRKMLVYPETINAYNAFQKNYQIRRDIKNG